MLNANAQIQMKMTSRCIANILLYTLNVHSYVTVAVKTQHPRRLIKLLFQQPEQLNITTVVTHVQLYLLYWDKEVMVYEMFKLVH